MSTPTLSTVHCLKLQKTATALSQPPYPGELGKRIMQQISAEAWQQWQAHQTMLINEYRLSVIEAKDRAFIEGEMIKFLFEGNATLPPDYTPAEQ